MNGIKSGYWSVETVEFLKVVLSNTGFVVKESDGISEVITIISLLESAFKQHLPIIMVNCAISKSEKKASECQGT